MNLPEGSKRANIAFADREVCTAVGYCIVRGSACGRLGLSPCLIAVVRPTKCCRGSHPSTAKDEERGTNGNGAESKATMTLNLTAGGRDSGAPISGSNLSR